VLTQENIDDLVEKGINYCTQIVRKSDYERRQPLAISLLLSLEREQFEILQRT
jgi:hypothetical protein